MAKVKIGVEEFSLQEIVEEMHKKFDSKFIDINVLYELDKPENIRMSRGDIIKHIAERVCHRGFMPTADEWHNCYWNDGFYAANRFDLNEHTKRITAIVALWNGRHNYWEWKTHGGFDMARLLGDMSIISRQKQEELNNATSRSRTDYFVLPKEIHDKIREEFALTKEELMAAPLLCKTIWDKERLNNKNSGIFHGLITAYDIN